ncbi:MAG: hypothetical protein AAFN93_06070 [Bacteroidota bacterium]
MKKIMPVIVLLGLFACNDVYENEIQLDGTRSSLIGGDGDGDVALPGDDDPDPDPGTGNESTLDLQDYYDAGYALGASDADWLVSQTWQNGQCVQPSFKTTDYVVEINNELGILTNAIKLERKLVSCPITTQAERLAFDNFISVYAHQVGYIQILENKINSSVSNSKAFYEGVLAGFKNRLCGWSITMPFNFTNCDAVDLPGSTTVIGGPSGGGTVCPTCPS